MLMNSTYILHSLQVNRFEHQRAKMFASIVRNSAYFSTF